MVGRGGAGGRGKKEEEDACYAVFEKGTVFIRMSVGGFFFHVLWK